MSEGGNCRLCGHDRSRVFLDLGESPLANGYLRAEQLDRPEFVYSLCTVCYCRGGRRIVADLDDFMMGPPAFDLCRLDVGVTTTFGRPDEDVAVRDRCALLAVEGDRVATLRAHVERLRAWSCPRAPAEA